jgi:hypothetical protein
MIVVTAPDRHRQPVFAGRRDAGRRRWLRRVATLLLPLGATVFALPWGAGAAWAAPSDDMPIGVDVSYPQCGGPVPTGQAFAIVGVNGGRPTTTNPCLAAQLAWAAESVGGTVQYGWERARDDATIRGIAHPEEYMWWLDVELANTWDYGDGGHVRNAAVLEGMTDYFTSIGSRGVGLYSTRHQWDQIVGNGVSSTSSLNGLSNWRPTGDSLDGAQGFCGLAPLTPGGIVEMTQYSTDYDYNYSCI